MAASCGLPFLPEEQRRADVCPAERSSGKRGSPASSKAMVIYAHQLQAAIHKLDARDY